MSAYVRASHACGRRDRRVRGSLTDHAADCSRFGPTTCVSFPYKTTAFLAKNLRALNLAALSCPQFTKWKDPLLLYPRNGSNQT